MYLKLKTICPPRYLSMVLWQLINLNLECTVIVFATLSAVEILKYPPFQGICFLKEIFSFFNLVDDFFSYCNFSKSGF